jgi:tight adherence protein B
MSALGPMLLYPAVFAGALLIVLGLAQLLGLADDGSARAITRRIHKRPSGADPDEILRMLRRQPPPEGFGRVPLLRHWPTLVTQAGVRLHPGLVLLLMLALAGLIGAILGIWLAWSVAVPAALLLGVAAPVLLLRLRRDRRRLELSRQLPEAIDLMVQSLRVGHPLNTAFRVIAREMPAPIGPELGIVADAITYGDDLTTAVDDLAQRIGAKEFSYLAVAINIQHTTGGNLASVLETLSRVVRDRFAMERKIRALSAEGRITALVVSAVPAVLGGFLHLTTPSYYGEVAGDPLFLPMLAIGGVLLTVNGLILRRLVNFHF